MVARDTARLLAIVVWQNVPVRVHSILDALRARIPETVIVGYSLEHVEPDGALLALEVPRLQLDPVQGVDCAARRRQFGPQAQLQSLAPRLATELAARGVIRVLTLLHVVALR